MHERATEQHRGVLREPRALHTAETWAAYLAVLSFTQLMYT